MYLNKCSVILWWLTCSTIYWMVKSNPAADACHDSLLELSLKVIGLMFRQVIGSVVCRPRTGSCQLSQVFQKFHKLGLIRFYENCVGFTKSELCSWKSWDIERWVYQDCIKNMHTKKLWWYPCCSFEAAQDAICQRGTCFLGKIIKPSPRSRPNWQEQSELQCHRSEKPC